MGGRGLTLSSSPARGLRFGKAGVENPPENRDPLLFSSCALLFSSSTLQWSYQHGLPAWLVGAIALMPPQPGSAAFGRTVFPRPACDAGSPRVLMRGPLSPSPCLCAWRARVQLYSGRISMACQLGSLGRLRSCRRNLVRQLVVERFSLDQHAMQDHRELACERHFRLRHADALGELHGPGLDCRGLHRARENDVCGLIERGAHALVADLLDPASVIDFARLISLRRDPIMCANLFRVLETCGVIDCGRICQ